MYSPIELNSPASNEPVKPSRARPPSTIVTLPLTVNGGLVGTCPFLIELVTQINVGLAPGAVMIYGDD